MNILSKLIPYRSIPILTYHQIGETTHEEDRLRLVVPTEIFESQMKYLHDHEYIPITLDELVKIEGDDEHDTKKHIAITFDDGYLDTYVNAFPILQKYKFPATIFVITDFFDKRYARDSNTCAPYMNWSHAKEMLDYGVSFQSHTCTHPHLTKLKSIEVLRELTASRKRIEDVLGTPCRHFAYPYGEYNNEVIVLVKEAGYQWAYTVGLAERGSFSRERFSVTLRVSPIVFSLMVSGWGSWVRTTRHSLFHNTVAKHHEQA